jgi:nucleoside-diphosphate-sugar epimerase
MSDDDHMIIGHKRATKTILMTGASGVVGSALLPEFADSDVLCLVHRQPPRGRVAGTVRGDLAKPRMGLDPRVLRELGARVDAIVHCAAVVSFNAGQEAAQSVNVSGTANLLELAELADAPLYYVSTAFVERAGQVDSEVGPGVYVASKRAAEQRVRDSGLPAVLIRPSVISGDAITGEMSQFQGLHGLCGACMRGLLPMIPVRKAAVMDFLPQDLVARCIADIVARDERAGEYWLTAGGAAVTMERIIDLCVLVAHERGLDVERPRLVDPEMMDRLIRPVFLGTLPKGLQRQYDHMLSTMALFHTEERFPSCLERLGRAVSTEQLERAFVQTLRFWAERKGLGNSERQAA